MVVIVPASLLHSYQPLCWRAVGGGVTRPYGLGMTLEDTWEFMVTMAATNLSQIIHSETQDSGHTLDMILLLELWQHDMIGDLSVGPVEALEELQMLKRTKR